MAKKKPTPKPKKSAHKISSHLRHSKEKISHHVHSHPVHYSSHARPISHPMHSHTIQRKEFIISQPSAFKEKKTFISTQILDHEKGLLYYSTSKFYSLPGQLDLVLHGVPFHLIQNQFMRFHAVQATILGWEFATSYVLLFFFSLINILFFHAVYLDILMWLFLTAVLLHSLMSMFYAYMASKGNETHLPFMGKIARRLAED